MAAQKDFKAAATASEQAIQMDDKRWEGYIVAAEAYSGQQLYDDAIGMLEMALVRAPADKKPAVRDAISETRKLFLPSSTATATLPRAPARTPNPNASNNDNGPSLEVTMKFIQDKLNERGPVRYTHWTNSGASHISVESSNEVSEVIVDPKTCLVSYHQKDFIDKDVMESDTRFNLKDVRKIVVESEEQIQNQVAREAVPLTPPQIRIVPQVSDLFLEKAGDWRNSVGIILFLDDDLANRVAKAFTHAVELCTPDRKSEPF